MNNNTVDDSECLKRERFKALVAKYDGDIRNAISRRMSEENLEDAVQTAYMNAWLAFDQCRSDDLFFPWMLGIIKRSSSHILRDDASERNKNTKFETTKESRLVANDSPDPYIVIVKSEERDIIRESIENIPDNSAKEILNMKYFDAMTVPQIAQFKSISINEVRRLLIYAHKHIAPNIRKLLTAYVAVRATEAAHATSSKRGNPALANAVEQSSASLDAEAVTTSVAEASRNVEPAIAAAAATVGGVRATLASFMAAFFLPMLFFYTTLAGVLSLGTTFVKNAPTLDARRWLIKRLFIFYCFIFYGPLALRFLTAIASYFVSPLQLATAALFCVVSLAIAVIWLIQKTVREYPFCCQVNTDSILYAKLHRDTSLGLRYGLLFLLVLVAFNIITTSIGKYSSGHLAISLALTTIIDVSLIAFHLLVSRRFRYFLSTSTGEEVFQKTFSHGSTIPKPTNAAFLELSRVYPFALFPLGANVTHLVADPTSRTAWAATEIVCYLGWWILTWYVNVKSPSYRWCRIFVTLFLQFVLMHFLRQCFYE